MTAGAVKSSTTRSDSKRRRRGNGCEPFSVPVFSPFSSITFSTVCPPINYGLNALAPRLDVCLQYPVRLKVSQGGKAACRTSLQFSFLPVYQSFEPVTHVDTPQSKIQSGAARTSVGRKAHTECPFLTLGTFFFSLIHHFSYSLTLIAGLYYSLTLDLSYFFFPF
jgi:hypothetical protein